MAARIPFGAGFALVAVVCACAVGDAQMKRPTAEVSPVAATDGQRAGSPARLALRVALPEGFHVQSDAPRDPTLIPTVLTIDAPSGVSVEEIVYPPPVDLEQVGQKQPLVVFEREFAIGVVIRVDSKTAPGEIALPASGRPTRTYSSHHGRHTPCGTANSRPAIVPPGRTTRASSRSVVGGSET